MLDRLSVCLRIFNPVLCLRDLKFWWYRRSRHVPHPDEIRSFFPIHGTPREWRIAKYYALYNFTLEEIAVHLNCTRERVRQIVWKIYRKNRPVYNRVEDNT